MSTAAVCIVAIAATGSPAMAADGAPPAPTAAPVQEEFLFSVESASGSTKPLKIDGPEDEKFRLTLRGVAPVTQFSDRPFRDAKLISVKALAANWEAWFAGDPPNSVLSFSRPGRAPGSMVVDLLNPSYDPKTRTLTFTAKRLAREHDPVEKGKNWQKASTPATMTDVSLFIDSMM